MIYVINIDLYKKSINIQKSANSLGCLWAIYGNKNHRVAMSYTVRNELLKICHPDDDSCHPQLSEWFSNMYSHRNERLICHDNGNRTAFHNKKEAMNNTLQQWFSADEWNIVRAESENHVADLDDVVLALRFGDKIILFNSNISLGCKILSQSPCPDLKAIDWKDSSKSTTVDTI